MAGLQSSAGVSGTTISQTTVLSLQTINGQVTSSSVSGPQGAVYLSPTCPNIPAASITDQTKQLQIDSQISLDGGATWRHDAGCLWQGNVAGAPPGGWKSGSWVGGVAQMPSVQVRFLVDGKNTAVQTDLAVGFS